MPTPRQLSPALLNSTHTQGAYAKAKPLYLRALAIYKKTMGPEHPYMVRTLSSLARLYHAQDAYVKAESLYHLALTVFVRSSGSGYPVTGTIMGNYVSLLQTMGKTEEEISGILRSIGLDYPNNADA